MSNEIVGTPKIDHGVDQNGSLTCSMPIQVSPAKMAPEITLSYHSASNSASAIGMGWAITGVSSIERSPATIAQDGFRGKLLPMYPGPRSNHPSGVVNYDNKDCFSLNGQRLMNIGNNEYRYELEQWSKIVAQGSNPANPDSWIEYLPDGSQRTYGASSDSNIKAIGKSATRVWSATEYTDAFSNYVSYSYINDSSSSSGSGAFYVSQISYGGNRNLAMAHQRQLNFTYENRPDITVQYIGGAKVMIDKRLTSITLNVQGELAHTYRLTYDQAPSTGVSRLTQVTIVDPSGASVRPIKFSWVNGNPAVFNNVEAPVVLNPNDTTAEIYPLDVSAKGKSDIVVASKRLSGGVQQLHLDVYETDANGAILTTPSSQFDGIQYPTQLIPLDFNGDGRNDFLHITQQLNSHTLTILLSTPSGYVAQPGYVFAPEFIGGNFYAGDFEGNGHVGLVYIYQVLVSGSPQIKFVQFISDGSKYTALPPGFGPLGVSVDSLKVVTGDMNGDYADDVFLISSKFVSGSTSVHIDLLQSQEGRLAYRSDQPLTGVAQSIPWVPTIAFLPYDAENDGKTSLLVATKDLSGNLQVQMLRSTGPTLLPPEQPITTNIAYSGNITLARTTSPFSVDVVNTFATLSGTTNVDVLRFFSNTFVRVTGVTQPGVQSSFVSWADLRGIGRADCLLATHDTTGKLSIATMPCSTLQPIDYVTGYENGLGAKVNVTYAPLSDRTTYTTNATPEGSDNEVGSPLPAINGLSRNVSFTSTLSSSSASATSAVAAHSRSQIVYFPSYVVSQLSQAPYAAQSSVLDETRYTYTNARYSYDGRGWEGFESITKMSKTLGSQVTTEYYQEFPLLRQTKYVSSVVANTSTLLQTTSNVWSSTSGNNGKTQYVALSSIKDSYYEGGIPTYDVNVTYQNDSFGNITSTTIQTQASASPLTILSEYQNDTSSWVIGNRASETVKQGNSILKQTKYTYAPKSSTVAANSQWVKDNAWVTQTMELDDAGNEITVSGPGPSLRKLGYDSTYTHCTSSTVYTSANNTLTESATYDLTIGQPNTSTTPNGEVTTLKYDVLGRVIETSLGNTVVARRSYEVQGNDFRKVEESLLDSPQSALYRTVSHIDGLNRVWRTERPRPDDPTIHIFSDIEYDGAGRLTRSSRDYFSGSSPPYATASYDTLSRIVQKTMPPASSDVPPLTITYKYSFSGGRTKILETRSDGNVSNDATTTQYVQAFPNPQPSSQNFVQNFIVETVSEVGEPVQTNYDAMGRPVSISDAAEVQLAIIWDGISRIVDKKISQPNSGTPKVIQHTSVTFDDNTFKTSVTNNLTASTVVTTMDWAQRPLQKTTPDETLTFSYDTGGQYTKERLVSVSSTKNIQHAYDYDIHGNLTSDTITIDGSSYHSNYSWSLSGGLLQATNPDGSTINRTLLIDGQSVSNIDLLDSSGSKRASVVLDDYSDVYSRPLRCTFGNGIIATATLAQNGTVATLSLDKNNNSLQSQSWQIDAFSRVRRHDTVTPSMAPGEGENTFAYNSAGQLTRRSIDADPAVGAQTPELFAYDQSGNLTQKGDLLFVNNGWQLSEIRSLTGATQSTFEYSADGNMISQIDASGQVQRSMEYNSDGRLSVLDGTSFVYDFSGRLIKATLPNGDIRIYPSQSYEVDITASGEETHTSYIVQGYRRASLSSSQTSSSVLYYHTDHLGSTVAVSDISGNVVTEYEYDPYGQVRTIRGSDLSRYKFSGKEQFGSLYYFGARFYAPEIGRFLTLDNYAMDVKGLRPSTFNMYTFSRNDPINYIDLNGNVPWWHWLVDALLVVAGVALMFVPGVNAIVLGVVTGALIGAGVSGFNYDISATISGESNDKDWGIQLGIGAVVGAIGGAASAGIDVMLPAASFSNLAGITGGNGLKVIGGFVLRTTARMALQTGLSSGLSALNQVAQNAISGRPLGEGVADAAATGAWQGAALAAVDFGFGAASREKTAVNKFWQKKGSYDLVPAKFNGTKLALDLANRVTNPSGQVALNYAASTIQKDEDQGQAGMQNNQNAQSNVPGQVSTTMLGSQISSFPRSIPIQDVSLL
ncbi:hypothetical protein EYR40_008196 [Pleurotus pulmonarius]|nr:hypothetical protein EYR40_008196 [Pleurotus pulmonarius]